MEDKPMLMAVCWSCGDVKQFNREEELYLLHSSLIRCPCGAENVVDQELKQNIRTDWGLSK